MLNCHKEGGNLRIWKPAIVWHSYEKMYWQHFFMTIYSLFTLNVWSLLGYWPKYLSMTSARIRGGGGDIYCIFYNLTWQMLAQTKLDPWHRAVNVEQFYAKTHCPWMLFSIARAAGEIFLRMRPGIFIAYKAKGLCWRASFSPTTASNGDWSQARI